MKSAAGGRTDLVSLSISKLSAHCVFNIISFDEPRVLECNCRVHFVNLFEWKLRQFKAAASRKFNHGRLLLLKAVCFMFCSQIDDSCCWWWLSLVYVMKRGAYFLNFLVFTFLSHCFCANLQVPWFQQKCLEMNENYLIRRQKKSWSAIKKSRICSQLRNTEIFETWSKKIAKSSWDEKGLKTTTKEMRQGRKVEGVSMKMMFLFNLCFKILLTLEHRKDFCNFQTITKQITSQWRTMSPRQYCETCSFRDTFGLFWLENRFLSAFVGIALQKTHNKRTKTTDKKDLFLKSFCGKICSSQISLRVINNRIMGNFCWKSILRWQ